MKPALLILIMDFLVASLFLYVSENPLHRSRHPSNTMAGSTPFIWEAVNEFNEELEESTQEYYTHYRQLAATTEIDTLLREKDSLKSVLSNKEEELQNSEKLIADTVQELDEAHEKIQNHEYLISSLNETVQQQSSSIDKLSDQSIKLTNEVLASRGKELDFEQQLKAQVSNIDMLQEELRAKSLRLAEIETKAAHAEELKHQIATLEREKKFIQAQIAEKLDVVGKEIGSVKVGQERTAEHLFSIDTNISELRQEIKKTLSGIIAQSEQRLQITESILYALQQHAEALKGEVADELKKEFDELKEKSAHLERIIQQAKSETDTDKSAQIAQYIQTQNQAIAALQNSIDSKGAAAILKSSSSEAASGIGQSRVEISGLIAKNGMLWGVNTDEIKTYPIAVDTGNSIFAISHKTSIGLDNSKILSDDLTKADFSLRFGETTPPSSMPLQQAFPLNSQCKIIATIAPTQQKGLLLFKSQRDLQHTQLNDLVLYKHDIKMAFQKLNSDTSIEIKSGGKIHLGSSWFASNKPKRGDFLVTQDGHLLCVMDDSSTCLLVTEENFSLKGAMIEFSSNRKFSETVKSYNSLCAN